MAEDKIKVSYFEKIDVVRFFAAMMVVVYHTYTSWLSHWHHPRFMTINGNGEHLNVVGYWINTAIMNGNFGVDIFFLISGFLITYLLLKEREAFGKINIPKFYVRRAFRIWPLYYLIIILAPYLISWAGATGQPNYPANLFFYNNFDTMQHHWWIYPFVQMWSLCVEEHFYLIWPFVIAFVPVKKLTSIMIGFIVLSICYRAYLAMYVPEYWYSLYLSTFSRFDVLVIGALVAYRHWQNPIKMTFSVSTRLMIYFVFIMAFCNDVLVDWNGMFLACFKKYIYVGIIGFAIMNYLFNERPLFNWANNKIIRYFGKISYGIYIFGNIIIEIIINKVMFPYKSDNIYLFWFLAITSTILLSIISYELYEKWFLKLKKRFELLKIDKQPYIKS